MWRLDDEQARELCCLLRDEDVEYRRLRRLAWRQTAYMRRNAVERLDGNAEEWRRYLPLALAARRRREDFVARLGEGLPEAANGGKSQFLLDYADKNLKQQVQSAVRRLLRTAEDLVRQNELNGNLATYCLDLAREEHRIFRESLLADPAGRYDGEAALATSTSAGVVAEKA